MEQEYEQEYEYEECEEGEEPEHEYETPEYETEPPAPSPFSMGTLAKDPLVLATVAVGAAAAALIGTNSVNMRQVLAGAMGGLSKQGLKLATQMMPNDPRASLLAAALNGATGAKPDSRPKAPPGLPALGEALWTQAQKLQSLAPAARTKVEALLAHLRMQGYSPEIVFAWRSLPTQKKLQSIGKASRSFGMHNAMHEGIAASLAVDIVDLSCGWSGPRATAFFKDLQKAAKAKDLFTRPNEPWHVQTQPDTALGTVLEAYKLSRQKT